MRLIWFRLNFQRAPKELNQPPLRHMIETKWPQALQNSPVITGTCLSDVSGVIKNFVQLVLVFIL